MGVILATELFALESASSITCGKFFKIIEGLAHVYDSDLPRTHLTEIVNQTGSTLTLS